MITRSAQVGLTLTSQNERLNTGPNIAAALYTYKNNSYKDKSSSAEHIRHNTHERKILTI